jgi:predicted  nucleic acid-binding Zn-ribbon protein
MATSSQILIDKLKEHIGNLISRYELVQYENHNLSDQLDYCKKEIETLTTKNRELEEKLDKLLVMDAFKASSADVKDAKRKIGKIVKEIDKCISLLND